MSALRRAVEAALLFHSAAYWGEAERLRWKKNTGQDEATTKNLCDALRAALDTPVQTGVDNIDLIVAANSDLHQQVEELREQIVWGHYEDVTPVYVQGIAGEHEINSPVTAYDVAELQLKVTNLEAKVDQLNRYISVLDQESRA